MFNLIAIICISLVCLGVLGCILEFIEKRVTNWVKPVMTEKSYKAKLTELRKKSLKRWCSMHAINKIEIESVPSIFVNQEKIDRLVITVDAVKWATFLYDTKVKYVKLILLAFGDMNVNIQCAKTNKIISFYDNYNKILHC